ncbi:MAG: precorrin-8X methylmutase [Candidatus Omnitrophica bacterium]|nr:precorrin-8X methylmutase [Candidatus Omnitrophota bacterium]
MKRILDPKKIEEKSFRIIGALLASTPRSGHEKEVVRRVIHATTDLDYAKNLIFHPMAIRSGLNAIREGSNIICDVGMVKAGLNKKTLSHFGGRTVCFIDDKNIVRQASRQKIARAILAMRKAAAIMDGAIIAIGNAPTALFEVCGLIKEKKVRPALVIGIPVGFVGAGDSKKELASLDIPYITNAGTKGGSSVACAITNAILKIAQEGR